MEIVIRISDKDYQLMKDGHIPFNILDKMMNGTPLPKHHGRLIDEREVVSILLQYAHSEQGRFAKFLVSKINEDVPTFIEGSDSE